MKKSEVEFLEILEEKSKEQVKLMESNLLPDWAGLVGVWLAVHPWRVIAPFAGLTYILLWMILGESAVEATLAIFGGYR